MSAVTEPLVRWVRAATLHAEPFGHDLVDGVDRLMDVAASEHDGLQMFGLVQSGVIQSILPKYLDGQVSWS
jgi:hypothetical protein